MMLLFWNLIFVPTSDSLSFRYVFGSQEYFAFENSQYNDVFGFFLSGPGITGPYSSPAFHPNGSVNLAIVPGSNPPPANHNFFCK
ncbi:MAG: choice-of-anchor L domain-containing protein [Flavobacteriales bacterium]